MLQYTFYVQGSRDAYILLSSTEKPVETDDVIEIRKLQFFNVYSHIFISIPDKKLS